MTLTKYEQERKKKKKKTALPLRAIHEQII